MSGSTMSEGRVAQLRLLQQVADCPPRGDFLDLAPLFEAAEQMADQQRLADDLEHLASTFEITLLISSGFGGWRAALRPDGRRALADFERLLGDREAQRTAAAQALARWIDDDPVAAQGGGVDDFLAASPRGWLGQPYDRGVALEALKRLIARERVYSGGTDVPAGPIALTLTRDGQDWVENGCPTGSSATAGPSSVSHHYGPTTTATIGSVGAGAAVNLAQGSPGATQSATVTIPEDEREHLVDALAALRAVLGAGDLLGPDVDREAAGQAVEDLAQEAGAPEPEVGRLRAAWDRLSDSVLDGGGTEVGRTLVASIPALAPSLGAAFGG